MSVPDSGAMLYSSGYAIFSFYKIEILAKIFISKLFLFMMYLFYFSAILSENLTDDAIA